MSGIPPARRAALRRRLLAWYDGGHRELPWRFPQRAADGYRVWLAEVMLQQTQVQAVIPYFERFLARFPTLDALAAAREEDVLALWSGLGYYARGRNLLAAARAARARHGGLPASVEALRALPGFGPYTAGAVASIAFAIPAPVVDGNVARVLARLFLVDGAPGDARTRARLWALAADLVDPARPGDLNQALMELGATVCGKPAPRCDRCPVAALCAARAGGREREVPPARLRPARRPLVLACALVERRGAVLVLPRRARGLFGGLLGPPAVEVAGGDDVRAALARTVRAEHGIDLAVGEEAAVVRRVLTHRELTLRGFRCEAARIPRGAEGAWIREAAGRRSGLPTAFAALIDTFFSTCRGVQDKKRPLRRGPPGAKFRDRVRA
ncbi:A/G-specific adenine glycosylase [Anaeromyxobacter oryzae]|uniref:A/G-specific adenine glycosylase n=1 Tax=Anaeromyxobacter oryzae TaxID=2918170 RepID=UPI0020BEFB8C|nr:A/G-specific adenine glycosylase [Anaeromyxobacter oryzae]